MAFVEPPKGRAKITELGDKVMIEIPMRPKGFVEWGGWSFIFLFLTGWLIGWAVGEIFALRQLGLLPQSERWTLQDSSSPSFLTGWLILWTAGGILAGYAWLRLITMLVGREVITVSPVSLDIVTRPIGRLRRYWLTEIKNLRVLESREETEGIISTRSVIAFDYGASNIRFGLCIDPAEARQIVALLKERFGQYMVDSKKGGM